MIKLVDAATSRYTCTHAVHVYSGSTYNICTFPGFTVLVAENYSEGVDPRVDYDHDGTW